MVNLQGKESTALKTIKQSLEDNLNIISSDSRLKTITDKIANSRYTFKLVDETGTLPISSERPSLLYKNWLFIAGTHDTGCGLIIIDINTMEIVKQVFLSSTFYQTAVSILSDGTYYYMGFSTGGLLVRGLLETGEVVNTTIQAIGATRAMYVDKNYIYTAASTGRIYKIDKITLTILQTGNVIYNSPFDIKCVGDYIYIIGTGTAPNTGVIAKVAKSDINTIVATSNSAYNSEVIWQLLIDDIYIYTASATGVVKKWLLSDLSYVSDVFTTGNNNPICTFKKSLNNFWIGDSMGNTYRVSETGNLLAKLQTSNSANYILEIDESNQILFRNARDDVTIAKYQIIDNLQNSTSTTVLKTSDLVTLNTAGTWVNTVYSLNNMAMTCNTLSNGYLRQLSFTGTTTADTTFILATPNVNNTLTPNTSYILNGVKSTDSLSTVFIRLTRYQNFDGSGLSNVTEKVAGDFKVFIAVNDDYLYYKIEIVIKSGVTLTNSLYNNIPSMGPSSITYGKGEGPYLIKDLSTITNTNRVYKMSLVDGKVFVLPAVPNTGNIQVFDYQTGGLLKTINDGANIATISICFDDNYIYISKCVERISDKKYRDVYIRKYNRCTLELVSESPILYTGISGATSDNYSNIFAIVENGEYLYLACIQTANAVGIRKIKKADFSSVAIVNWNISLNMVKHTNGIFVMGTNAASSSDGKYMRIDLLDWDLNVVQTFPQTTLTVALFRNGFYKDDFLYVGNDKGVLVKYQISTNTIAAQTQISEIATILNIVLINDNYILLQTNTSKTMLYDLNLTFIKMWNFYNTTTTGGYMIDDNNNTIWTQSASQPTTIYKKQFIDLSSGVM